MFNIWKVWSEGKHSKNYVQDVPFCIGVTAEELEGLRNDWSWANQ